MRQGILSLLALGFLGACAQNADSKRFELVETYYQEIGAPEASPGPEARWTPVTLPQVVRSSPAFFPKTSSARNWETHWYRLSAIAGDSAGNETGSGVALYIPRVRWPRLQGHLDVFVNGVPLDGSTIVWNSPVIVDIPHNFTEANSPLEVLIALSLERGQSGAISRVWVGDADELHLRHAWREFFQQRVPQVTAITFAILGVFSFFFWFRRRSEVAYLLFSIVAATNLLRNAHYYLVNPESFGNGFWWLIINSLAWQMLAAHLFAVRLHGQRFPRTEKLLIGCVVVVSIGSLLAVLTGVTIERWGPLAYLSQILAGLIVPTFTTIGALRSRSRIALALAAALWINVILGIHDLLLTNWRIDPESVILLPFGAMTILGIFLFSLGQRYMQAIDSAEQQLAARTRELEESHRRLRVVEQEQAVIGERQRLMREMHDGLGSSLMSSLVMVENGKLDAGQIAEVLRESIDDLKLTIDSLEPMENDLLTLLGTLRYRLGKRLGAAGIKLDWKVEETPPLPWLNPTSALQILRILQEALTNTLKHARASVIRVETLFDATTISIRLTDNGVGFDAKADRQLHDGRGLKNLERRADTLGANIQIESVPGRTSVALVLKRERRIVARDLTS
jgi:signal transduction histidine kinase